MKINIKERPLQPGEWATMLDQADVERAWKDYERMSPFVQINPSGDEPFAPTARGFAQVLRMGYGLDGFDVEIEGDTVHVTPPNRRLRHAMGLSVRTIAE